MAALSPVIFTRHDVLPAADAAVVDQGLGEANAAAAPLHEVQPLACFARTADDAVIGGAVGRTWGPCAELQQLWVDPAHRRGGLGARLLREFESAAIGRGVTDVYLETLSFQAPDFYRALGYKVAHALAVYPRGIVRYLLVRHLVPDEGVPR